MEKPELFLDKVVLTLPGNKYRSYSGLHEVHRWIERFRVQFSCLKQGQCERSETDPSPLADLLQLAAISYKGIHLDECSRLTLAANGGQLEPSTFLD